MKFLLIALFPLSLFASGFKINEKVPEYLSSLLKQVSKENKDFSPVKVNSFLNTFESQLNFFESKIIVAILDQSLMLDKDNINMTQETFNMAKNSLSKIDESLPFSKIVFSSFINDLAEMITDRKYNSYLVQERSTNRKSDPTLKDFTKKMRLIKPWIKLLIMSSEDQITIFMRDFNTTLINNLIQHGLFLNKMNKARKSTETKNFIVLVDDKLEKARKEVDALEFKLFPQKSKGYKTPEKLPKPINDWMPK